MPLVLSRERGVQGRPICEFYLPIRYHIHTHDGFYRLERCGSIEADLAVNLHHHDRKWYPTCLHRRVFVDHQNLSTRLPSKPNPLSQCFQLPRHYLDPLAKQPPTTAWVYLHPVATPPSSFRRQTPADRGVRKSTRGDLD
jgi:hypothetical protein